MLTTLLAIGLAVPLVGATRTAMTKAPTVDVGIDDLYLDGPMANDYYANTTQQIIVDVYNYGTQDVENVSIDLRIEDGTAMHDNISIAYTDSWSTVEFNWTPMGEDEFWINVSTTVEGDENATNNYRNISITVQDYADVETNAIWLDGQVADGVYANHSENLTLSLSNNGNIDIESVNVSVAVHNATTMIEDLGYQHVDMNYSTWAELQFQWTPMWEDTYHFNISINYSTGLDTFLSDPFVIADHPAYNLSAIFIDGNEADSYYALEAQQIHVVIENEGNIDLADMNISVAVHNATALIENLSYQIVSVDYAAMEHVLFGWTPAVEDTYHFVVTVNWSGEAEQYQSDQFEVRNHPHYSVGNITLDGPSANGTYANTTHTVSFTIWNRGNVDLNGVNASMDVHNETAKVQQLGTQQVDIEYDNMTTVTFSWTPLEEGFYKINVTTNFTGFNTVIFSQNHSDPFEIWNVSAYDFYAIEIDEESLGNGNYPAEDLTINITLENTGNIDYMDAWVNLSIENETGAVQSDYAAQMVDIPAGATAYVTYPWNANTMIGDWHLNVSWESGSIAPIFTINGAPTIDPVPDQTIVVDDPMQDTLDVVLSASDPNDDHLTYTILDTDIVGLELFEYTMLYKQFNASETGEYYVEVEVYDGAENDTLMFNVSVVRGAGSIVGWITDAETEAALSGVNVSVELTAHYAHSDASGYYSIDDVAPGTYNITAEMDGYITNETSVVVPAGDAVLVNFSLSAAAPEYGSIFGGVNATNGTPLAGVTITIDETGATATTNATGYFEFPEVEPDTYNLSAELEGYETVMEHDVTVEAGVETQLDFQLAPIEMTGWLTGTVTTDDGGPITGVNVTVRGEMNHTLELDENATFMVELAPTSYQLTAVLEGYEEYATTVLVTADNINEANITLVALPAHIYGSVTPATATLTIDDQSVTVTDGNFSIERDAGSYFINATADGYQNYSKELTVARDEERELPIVLVPTEDTTAPAAVSGLQPTDLTTDDEASVRLTWTANTEDDLAGYYIFQSLSALENLSGRSHQDVDATQTSYTVDGLSWDTTYHFAVVAVDDAGNYLTTDYTQDTITTAQRTVEPTVKDWVRIGPFTYDGEPLSGATVTFEFNDTTKTGVTDDEGYANISVDRSWAGATIDVKVEKDDYETNTFTQKLPDQLGESVVSADDGTLEKTEEAAPPLFLYILLLIIVVIIVVLLVMFLRKGRVPEEIPLEEVPTPYEEEPLYEEAIGEFECPSCGAVVGADVTVCPECGEEFEEEEYRCPSCGVHIEKDAIECEACGEVFEPEAFEEEGLSLVEEEIEIEEPEPFEEPFEEPYEEPLEPEEEAFEELEPEEEALEFEDLDEEVDEFDLEFDDELEFDDDELEFD